MEPIHAGFLIVVIIFGYYFFFGNSSVATSNIPKDLGVLSTESQYDQIGYPISTPFLRDSIPYLERDLLFQNIFKKYKTVVDLGCGLHYGVAAAFFEGLGLHYIGVDAYNVETGANLFKQDMLSFLKEYTESDTIFILAGIDMNIISEKYATEVVRNLAGRSVIIFDPMGRDYILEKLKKERKHTISENTLIYVFE